MVSCLCCSFLRTSSEPLNTRATTLYYLSLHSLFQPPSTYITCTFQEVDDKNRKQLDAIVASRSENYTPAKFISCNRTLSIAQVIPSKKVSPQVEGRHNCGSSRQPSASSHRSGRLTVKMFLLPKKILKPVYIKHLREATPLS